MGAVFLGSRGGRETVALEYIYRKFSNKGRAWKEGLP